MSLLRQLLISVSVAIFIIVAGVVWLTTDAAREYLHTQLQAQTDSAATSLALTLSQPSNQDEITRELIIAALFDSGQFSRIVFEGVGGELLVDKQVARAHGAQVPDWFVHYASIGAVRAAAQVSDGWRQVGQVVLEADPGYARLSLWHNFLRLVGLVFAAGVAWAVVVFVLIRWLRRMLHDEVTKQLELMVREDAQHAPMADESHAVARRATFIELREVRHAIASARQSILSTAEERHAKIESLQLELNQDPVTRLPNRKFMINELRSWLEAGRSGWILVFRLRDLVEINRVLVRSLVDDWLLSLSQQLKTEIGAVVGTTSHWLGRLNGSDFVLLIETVDDALWQRLVRTIQDELMRQRIQLASGEFCRWALAQTDFGAQESFSHVLARLDQALMRAESAGHGEVEVLLRDASSGPERYLTQGESQWRDRLMHALHSGGFKLAVNERRLQNEVWYEATLMLQQPDEEAALLSAYQFMPVATRLGLSGACDLCAVDLALQWLQNNDQRLILRVSLPSLSQPALVQELPSRLAALNEAGLGSELCERLYIELDAYALQSALPIVQNFAQIVQPFGVQLGVRRILQIPQVVLEFADLQLAYARINPDTLAEVQDKPGGLEFIKALWGICQQAQTPWVIEDGHEAFDPQQWVQKGQR